MRFDVPRWVANLLIWTGLALIIFGCALTYPFMRDAIQAQSDPSTSLSFVVTLPPTTVDAATITPAMTPVDTATSAPTLDVSVTPSPIPPATAVPSPVVLPDNSTGSAAIVTPQAVLVPTPIPAGDPPDRIVIPAIQLDAPVQAAGWHIEQGVSVWDVPARRAAGWLKTSAPAGQKGNTVLDGHHNIEGEVFKRLVDLKPGDVIELYSGIKIFRYGVTEKHILPDRDQPLAVRIANAQWIQPTDDERLTLVTCWPYTSNTHRLIIVARPLAPGRMEKTIE
jgi:LPXTG-site transpeptidase (sortase) family protein